MVIFYLFISLIVLFVIVISWITIDILVKQSRAIENSQETCRVDNLDHENAILLVQAGGRIIYSNKQAKILFDVPEKKKIGFSDLEGKTENSDIYKLFNNPGKTFLTIKKQSYEANSYLTSDGMLVSFQPTSHLQVENQINNNFHPNITLFLERLSNNTDLVSTLKYIFVEYQNVFLCDTIELGFLGELQQDIEVYSSIKIKNKKDLYTKTIYHLGNCFAGLVIQKNQKIFIEDITTTQIQFKEIFLENNIRQLLAVPLNLDDQTFGVIIFGNVELTGFSRIEEYIQSTNWRQLEIVLHNTWIAQVLKRKSSELSGLSKLSISLSHIKDPQELIQTILANFGNLIPIDIFGFILFNDRTQILEAMKPFQGLPDPIVEIIRIKIEPESPAEKIIYSQDILMIENAIENTQWADLGLTHLANAASINEAVLIPLAPGSDPMGFLLAANHNNGSYSFTQDEIHSLMIVANQTAPLIENLFLIIQSKQRTQQAELLRRISSISNSNATQEEVLAFTVNEISLLLHADFGGIFLLNQNNTKLVWNKQAKFGDLAVADEYHELLVSSPEFQQTITFSKDPLLIGKFNETKPIPGFYQEVLDRCGILSAIIVPLVVRNQGVGELWIGNHQLNYFDEGDIQIAFSVANQLAYVVDRDKLSLLTQTALNEKIEQEKLIDELQKLNLFGKKIVNLEAKEICEELLNSLMVSIPVADSGWIGLFDDCGQLLVPAILRSYSSELQNLSFGKNTLPLQSLINDKIILKHEVNFPDTYGLNEDQAIQYLKATSHQLPTSCIIAPIQTSTKQFGIVMMEIFDIEKSFSSDDESIILSFLQHTNYALENAELIRSLKSQSLQLARLADLSKTISSNLNPEDLRKSLLQKLKVLVDYENATLWELDRTMLKIVATDGFQDAEQREGIRVEVEDSLIFKKLIDTQKSVVITDTNKDSRFPTLIEAENLSWMGIPLITQKGISGVIALEKKESDFYNPSLVQIAETFASQAAIALENANLFEESSTRSFQLDERSRKLSYLNRFSSDVNQLLEVSQIYSLVTQSFHDLLNCEMLSIFNVRESGNVELVFTKPPVPKQIFINQPFFEKLQQTGGVYQITDFSSDEDIEFLNNRLFEARKTKSILFFPLLKSDKVFGWIGLESSTERRFLHREVELGQTIANQAAMAINNALLFQEANGYKVNLEDRVQERTHELMIEHRNTEILLKISSELASSMDIDQIMTSTLKIVNRSLGLSGSFIYIKENKKLIQQIDGGKGQKSALITSKVEDLLHKVRTEKSSHLDNTFEDNSFVIQRGSILLLPIIFGEVVLGELVMVQETKNFFTKKDVSLGEAIAGQISMALNNSEIFNLVREQSENLGVLFRDQAVETTRSRAMLEAVADGVLVTGNQAEIILLNKSGLDILRVKKDLFEENISGLETYFGERITPWLSIIREWTEHPSKVKRNSFYSERLNLLDDQVVSIHLSPVIFQNEFLGTVSVFRDITLEVQIDQLKSDFISNISHELRTPLTSIKGFVEVLLMGASGPLNEQQKHFMEVIQANATRMNKLVDEILDVSKIESEQFQLSLESVSLQDLIKDAIQEQENISNQEKKNIKISTDIAKNLPKISIDKYRIKQVLGNILTNARDYSENGGTIKIHAYREGETIRVSVIDSGIGLSKEDQKHAFERFYRGKNAVDVNSVGTGIGLSIAETLIKMHGGKIELKSSGVPGEGTEVTFWLPITSKKVE